MHPLPPFHPPPAPSPRVLSLRTADRLPYATVRLRHDSPGKTLMPADPKMSNATMRGATMRGATMSNAHDEQRNDEERNDEGRNDEGRNDAMMSNATLMSAMMRSTMTRSAMMRSNDEERIDGHRAAPLVSH